MTAPVREGAEFDALDHVRALLEAERLDDLREFLSDLPHASDVAALLEELDEEERAAAVGALAEDPALTAEALAEMEPEEHPEESLAALEPEQIAAVVAEMSDDDAADMIGELDPEDQARVLSALPHDEAGDIRELMRYPEDSAGGMMTTELVTVPVELTAAGAIEEIRRQSQEVDQFYVVFVVEGDGVLSGFLPLPRLVTAAPGASVRELVEPVPAVVLAETDSEEVARVVSRYNLTVVPVVDAAGRLLGGVTFDDVIDVIEAETTEDILRLGGASAEEELRGGWWDAVRSRFPWLVANLFTAAGGATVVSVFSETIEQRTALAVLMPVVAGMGGNSGTQALAVTVRRLALGQESVSRHWSIVGKELLVGLGNGLVIGIIVAALALLIDGDPRLGLVVMLAMWLNLTVGSFAGAFVPIVLERLGADPAVASSIFVTALTDMVGFFLLLGLATQFVL